MENCYGKDFIQRTTGRVKVPLWQLLRLLPSVSIANRRRIVILLQSLQDGVRIQSPITHIMTLWAESNVSIAAATWSNIPPLGFSTARLRFDKDKCSARNSVTNIKTTLTKEIMAARSNIFTNKSSNCSMINLHNGLPATYQQYNHTSILNSTFSHRFPNRDKFKFYIPKYYQTSLEY